MSGIESLIQVSQSDISIPCMSQRTSSEVLSETAREIRSASEKTSSQPAIPLQPGITRNEFFEETFGYLGGYQGLRIHELKRTLHTRDLPNFVASNASNIVHHMIHLTFSEDAHLMFDISVTMNGEPLKFFFCSNNFCIQNRFTERNPLKLYQCRDSNLNLYLPLYKKKNCKVESNDVIEFRTRWATIVTDSETNVSRLLYSTPCIQRSHADVFYFNGQLVSSQTFIDKNIDLQVSTLDNIFDTRSLPHCDCSSFYDFNFPTRLYLDGKRIHFDDNDITIHLQRTVRNDFLLRTSKFDDQRLVFSFETEDMDSDSFARLKLPISFGTNAYYVGRQVFVLSDQEVQERDEYERTFYDENVNENDKSDIESASSSDEEEPQEKSANEDRIETQQNNIMTNSIIQVKTESDTQSNCIIS